jgi:TRAP-type C4-dicarboxylate transport system permease small subunit
VAAGGDPVGGPDDEAERPERRSAAEWAAVAFPAAVLMALLLCSFLDVAGRGLFNSPLPGAVELSEMMMALLVASALPLVTAKNAHIVVDFLDPVLGPRLRRVQAVVVALFAIALLVTLAWQLWLQALDMAQHNAETAFLGLPMAPVIGFMAAMCAVAAVVHLWLLARRLRSGKEE